MLVVETQDNDIEVEEEQIEIEGARGASTMKMQADGWTAKPLV